jgi:serine/threonine protein kinase
MRAIVNAKFRIKTVIGSGGFGTVYSGEDFYEKTEVAIKVQTDPREPGAILNESSVYETINGASGFPYVYELGCEDDRHYIVMELLGCSLSALFSRTSRTFSLATVLMLAEQMLARVEYLHRKGWVHRDIKPSNFLMGLNSRSNEIYLIDFGLATPLSGESVPFGGTTCYASINVQSGLPPGRRDDLESLGYVLIYLAKGSLPWRDIATARSRTSFGAVLQTKVSVPISELCDGLPAEFQTYMEAVRRLGLDEIPDYAALRGLFRDLFRAREFLFDYRYDWLRNVRSQLSFTLEIPKLVLGRPRPRVNQLKSLGAIPCPSAPRGMGSLPPMAPTVPPSNGRPPKQQLRRNRTLTLFINV